MMVMRQIAPGADYLSVLRLYFGQTKQHIVDVGLTAGHITATQTALPKNVPIDHSFKSSPMSATEWLPLGSLKLSCTNHSVAAS